MHITKIQVAAAFAAVSLFPLTALAGIPHQCNATWSARNGYHQGYNHQTSFLDEIWDDHYDCDRLEDFVDSVTSTIPYSSTSSLYLQCRLQGMSDATYDVVDDKYDECQSECFKTGADAGGYYGVLYCGFTFSIPGHNLGLCEATLELGCKTALRDAVHNLCASKAQQDPHFDDYVDSSCAM